MSARDVLTQADPAGVPSLPGLPTPPPGTPGWLAVTGYLFAALGMLGIGGVVVKIIDGVLGRRRAAADSERAEVEADEVFTKVAVTLVEPLRDRLDKTEQRLTEAIARHERDREAWEAQRERDRQAFDQQLTGLRGRIREALAEADQAVAESHRLRLLVQKWHRAIMDPAATIDWLRQLVGPDEPAI